VKDFWESNPLWTGESEYEPGSLEFFEEHRNTTILDCLAGSFDHRFIPVGKNREYVLDLGCGPGFWVIELSKHGCKHIMAADLTENAIQLTRKRCQIYGITAEFSQQNAESITFPDSTFTHVNCQGVIHHTPDTQACISEIARILKPDGTASISVYYRNVFLRFWPLIKGFGRFLNWFGAGMKGRGREKIYSENNPDELVRLYDGTENPIGKSYSKESFIRLLSPYFEVEDIYLHFFPARTLPFSIPKSLHRFLDKNFGFLIYVNLRKK